MAGTIELLHYDSNLSLTWEIESNCSSVVIYSTTFSTEQDYDFLTIESSQYSGSTEIYQHVPSTFTVTFTSDHSVQFTGFVLQWQCHAETVTSSPAARNRLPPDTRCSAGNPFTSAQQISRIINGVEVHEHSWPWIVRQSFKYF